MSAGQFIVCNSSDCKICLVKIFFFSIKQCFSQGSLKMDSKYLCSTRRNSSQLLRNSSRGAPARAPGEAVFCPGKGCAGTGHCCSCSAEALRSRALCCEYSVPRKGRGALLDLPILTGRTGLSPSSHTGLSLVLGRVTPSLAPGLLLIPNGWECQLWKWILGCPIS